MWWCSLVGIEDTGLEPESHLATWIWTSHWGHTADWNTFQRVNADHVDRAGVESWGTAVVAALLLSLGGVLSSASDSLSLIPTSGSLDLLCDGPLSCGCHSTVSDPWVLSHCFLGGRSVWQLLGVDTVWDEASQQDLPTAKGGGASNQTFSRTSRGTRPLFFPLRTLIKPSCSSSEVRQIWMPRK